MSLQAGGLVAVFTGGKAFILTGLKGQAILTGRKVGCDILLCMVAIDLTWDLKAKGFFETFGSYRRLMYELHGIELADLVKLRVIDWDVEGFTLNITAFYVKDGELLYPAVDVVFDKADFEEVLEQIKYDFGLPEKMQAFELLEDATLMVGPDSAVLYIDVDRFIDDEPIVREIMGW